MARIMEASQAGQLDFFGSEQGAMIYHLDRLFDEPSPDAVARIHHDVSVLRTADVIVPSTIDAVEGFLDRLPSLESERSLTDTEIAEAVGGGIMAAAIVGRVRGISRQTKGNLYVRSEGLLSWLERKGATSAAQLAMPAAALGTIYGHPNDLKRAYDHLDIFMRDRRTSLERNWHSVGDPMSVRLRQSLVDLSVKDRSDQPVSRVHQAHLDVDEAMASGSDIQPPRARVTLELLRIIDIIERRRALTGRILHHALGLGIAFDEKLVGDVIVAQRSDREHTSLYRFVANQLFS